MADLYRLFLKLANTHLEDLMDELEIPHNYVKDQIEMDDALGIDSRGNVFITDIEKFLLPFRKAVEEDDLIVLKIEEKTSQRDLCIELLYQLELAENAIRKETAQKALNSAYKALHLAEKLNFTDTIVKLIREIEKLKNRIQIGAKIVGKIRLPSPRREIMVLFGMVEKDEYLNWQFATIK